MSKRITVEGNIVKINGTRTEFSTTLIEDIQRIHNINAKYEITLIVLKELRAQNISWEIINETLIELEEIL